MSNQSENLKVIFFQPESDQTQSRILADGYFSFVPTFKEGEEINISLAKVDAINEAVKDPIGHKTHQVLKTDWVMLVDEQTKNTLATLVISVSEIDQVAEINHFTSIVGTHS